MIVTVDAGKVTVEVECACPGLFFVIVEVTVDVYPGGAPVV